MTDDRRKTLGRRISRHRRAAGHRSARAFADAIGISEGSVAHAESGSPRTGRRVYDAIEAGLDWPEGSIQRYLDTGDEQAFEPGPRRTSDADVEQAAARRAYAIFDLAQMLAAGVDAKAYSQALGRHYARLGESTNMAEIAEEALRLAEDPVRLQRVQEEVQRAMAGSTRYGTDRNQAKESS